MQLDLLSTDILVWTLLILLLAFSVYTAQHEHLRAPWREVFSSKRSAISLVFLSAFVLIGALDSIHFKQAVGQDLNGQHTYSAKAISVLDLILDKPRQVTEKTYSSPFALNLFVKENIELADGRTIRDFPRLAIIPKQIQTIEQRNQHIQSVMIRSSFFAIACVLLCATILLVIQAGLNGQSLSVTWQEWLELRAGQVPYLIILTAIGIVLLIACNLYGLAQSYHVLGTDKIGEDVFVQALKSIRTGLIIGSATTLITLPFALLLGMMAGYFRGWVDDLIQYTYTTLSSIPGVLLIAAFVLMLQVFIANNPTWFNSITARADARLLALCLILGLTSWTSLCRLLRGETLKLRELDYVQAAKAMGVNHFTILFRHLLPNLLHLVLIAIALDFSGLVLAEAVLSYVGVGVDPSTYSWGNMINQARLELARIPVVWWSLVAAFVFMFILVLSANIFSDSIRDAFDPRLRKQ